MRLINTLYEGGIVTDITPHKLTSFERGNNDSQFYYLSTGSLVIPREHVPLVLSFMEKNNLQFPKSQAPYKPQLTKLVIGEAVIPRGNLVKVVNDFLWDNNIRLPDTEKLR